MTRNYKNATDTIPSDWYQGIIDPNKGLKIYIDLTPQTYAYLIASGVAVFALGGILWHLLPKLVK